MDDSVLEELPRFSWAEIKKRLAARTPFEAISPMGTALIRVLRYEPLFGLAPHAGHHVREELQTKMAMDETERKLEEDPATDRFVAAFPVQMIGLDSRYEYDVSRPRADAVYLKPFQSWGKKVWKTPPSKDELAISYQKWDEFHELTEFLVGQFVEAFGTVIALDVHAYNPTRPAYVGKSQKLPLFHAATSDVDRKQHAAVIDSVLQALGAVALPGIPTTVKENDLFKKDGELVKKLSSLFPYSLFLPIEVKCVCLDTESGELKPEPVRRIAEAFDSVAGDLSSRLTKPAP